MNWLGASHLVTCASVSTLSPEQASQRAELVEILGWMARMAKADRAVLACEAAGSETIALWSAPRCGAGFAEAAADDNRIFLRFEPAPAQQWSVTLERRAGARRFSEHDQRVAGRALDALRYAVKAWLLRQAELQRTASFEEIVNAEGIGIILLDPSGQITFTNRSARAILEQGDGLVRVQGRLSTSGLRDSARLQAAINYVLALPRPSGGRSQDEVAPLLSLARGNGPPLSVAVFGLNASMASGAGSIAVCIADPTTDVSAAVATTCEMYGLTQAETRLAKQIVAGLTINEAAAAIRIREHTARACLRQVFSKLGVGRQADVVRVLLGGIIRLQARFVSLPT